jgi:filamentous hemagglutinin family protein
MEVFTIKQGDADTLTETVSGVTSLSCYTAKLIITEADGTNVDTITGTVNATGLTATYQLINESTKAYPLGLHHFETKVFDTSDHVYTPSAGFFIVEQAFNSDPS